MINSIYNGNHMKESGWIIRSTSSRFEEEAPGHRTADRAWPKTARRGACCVSGSATARASSPAGLSARAGPCAARRASPEAGRRAAPGCAMYRFDREHRLPPAAFDGVTHILVSVPPDAAGDPVLDGAWRRHRRVARPRLARLSVDDRRLRRSRRRLGRRELGAAPERRARPAPRRRPSPDGSICGAAAACRCTSSGSPRSTAPAAARSRRCAPAPRSASTSRARSSRASMSRIWRAC